MASVSVVSRVLNADYDLVIVGAGPAGMAAAVAASDQGVASILLIDREPETGGILNQCIHAGFGLHWFKEELTGPEYAERFADELKARSITLLTDAFVMEINAAKQVKVLGAQIGLRFIQAGAIILAMGARERTRGAVHIPGDRPAGVFTAGLAQKFVNQLGYLPGRRAVILGSGDIGLIMARRLTLEQVAVEGVYEIMPYANGLNRNIVQCLQDFGIPLHLSTTVVEIHGRERLTGVTVAPVGLDRTPMMEQARRIECDTLLLSIGLIPENELSRQAGLTLDPMTSGPVVDSQMQTSCPGIFACGNVVHIHDLVDYVSAEATLAGECAARYILANASTSENRSETIKADADADAKTENTQADGADSIKLIPGRNVRYCVPHTLTPGREQTVYLRVTQPLTKVRLRIGPNYTKRLRYAFPAEMISVRLTAKDFDPILASASKGNRLNGDGTEVSRSNKVCDQWTVEVTADE